MAQVSRAIAADHTLAANYTWANRLVAVVSDGSAVLGLGDIGPAASLPVMEGKSALFKTFGGLDSIPIVLDTKDPDEIVETLVRLRPTFGAVNLEDISAPRCFEIERRVIEALDCPVMHDDQHGTAIVVLAALLGATKVLDRDMHSLRVVISGRGRRGRGLRQHPARRGHLATSPCWTRRASCTPAATTSTRSRPSWPRSTNPDGLHRRHGRGARGRRRVPGGVRRAWCPRSSSRRWRPTASCSRCPTPTRRSIPTIASKYAAVVATGRSDFPNQINNVLAFPGVFRGALDAGARRITEEMKVAAAEAIFSVVGDDLAVDHIVPSALDPRVGPAVAAAVAAASQALSVADAPAGAVALVALMRRRLRRSRRAPPSIAVGSESDPESALLAHVYAAALRFYGSPAHVEPAPDPLADLDSGEVTRRARVHRPAAAAVRPGRDRARRTSRCTGRWSRRCPRASPPATTRRPPRTSPRSRSPRRRPRRGADATSTALVAHCAS